jgi:hypothetical protein
MQNSKRMHPLVQYAVTCCLVIAAGTSQATDGANLAGTWKNMAPQSSLKPEDGVIPFTAEGKKRYAENKRFQARKNYDEYDYTTSRCSAPGVPRIMLTGERFEILLQPDVVLMAFEWNRVRRLIALPQLAPQKRTFNLGPSTEDLVGTKMGTSTGRWDGDTLVVTTGKFSDRTLIDDLVPHGYDLKVSERLRLRDANTLEDRIKIEDPEHFTRPWEAVLTFQRQPDIVIPEQVCLDRLLGPPPLPTR